jgi:hypothetical protein
MLLLLLLVGKNVFKLEKVKRNIFLFHFPVNYDRSGTFNNDVTFFNFLMMLFQGSESQMFMSKHPHLSRMTSFMNNLYGKMTSFMNNIYVKD